MSGWKTTRNLNPDEIQQELRRLVDEGRIAPEVVKIPQWPSPKVERPESLLQELERRQRMAALRIMELEEAIQDLEDPDKEAKRRSEIPVPVLRTADEEVEIYPLREPHAYAQIIRRKDTDELLYHVIEPELTPQEVKIRAFVTHVIVDVLQDHPGGRSYAELREHLLGNFHHVMQEYGLALGDEWVDPQTSEDRIMYYLERDFLGEGPIDAVLRDPNIEDISCDGPNVPIYVYHRTYESIPTTVHLSDEDELDRFVVRMAQRCGRHISIATPILDGTLPDGSRLQATLSKEVTSNGSTFTIRKFRDVPFSPVDLIRLGTVDEHILAYWWLALEHHLSGILAGGTASGKTTALNAILSFIPPRNKVVTIEDTRELRVPEPHWISGVTRDGFGAMDGAGRQSGQIDMFQLLKSALRQRPEFIIVGEVRGKEAYNLFQAMATGHAAYGTIHADSVDAVIHRLESEPMHIPRNLLEALDVVAVQVQTRVGGKRVRRMRSITELVGMDPNTNEVLTNEVFRWDPREDRFIQNDVSYQFQRIANESGRTLEDVEADARERAAFLRELHERGVRDFEEVNQAIRRYKR